MADIRYTINAFTVNLEELPREVAARQGIVPTDGASVEAQAHELLALFESFDVRSTFFIEPQIVERNAGLIRSIAQAGHELALLSPRFYNPIAQLLGFREAIAAERARLQDLSGQEIVGFRALRPGSSRRSPAMIETLVQEGFTYSSSIYPPTSLHIDMLAGKRRAHRLHTPSGSLWELPLTVWNPLGVGIPSIRTGGGPLLSRLPVWIVARGVQGMNRHGEPANLFIHSWGLHAGESIRVLQHGSLRQYGYRDHTLRKLETIFSSYRFGSIREAYSSRLSLNYRERPRLYRSGIFRYVESKQEQAIIAAPTIFPLK